MIGQPLSRTVVVTGASRGLGLEFVRQLSHDPRNLIVAVARNPTKAEQLQNLAGPNVVVVRGDLADLDSFQSIAEEISKVGNGKVDVLINNAGIMSGTGAAHDIGISKSTPGEWTEQFHTNVTSLVFFTIALLPLLEHGTEKKVINMSSMLGDIGFALNNPDSQFSSYSVSKAGVTMATAKFHVEFKEKGFIFIALNPGWVNTDLAGEGKGVYAPLQPVESISKCLGFVNRCTAESSGRFFTLDGRTDAATH